MFVVFLWKSFVINLFSLGQIFFNIFKGFAGYLLRSWKILVKKRLGKISFYGTVSRIISIYKYDTCMLLLCIYCTYTKYMNIMYVMIFYALLAPLIWLLNDGMDDNRRDYYRVTIPFKKKCYYWLELRTSIMINFFRS